MAETVADLTAKGVLEAYYAIPGRTRERMCWVMSSQTADALWAELRKNHEAPFALRPDGIETVLVGRPVRIDDTAEGLSYETLDPDDEWHFA